MRASQTERATDDGQRYPPANHDSDCRSTNRRWRSFGLARTPTLANFANNHERGSGFSGGWRWQSTVERTGGSMRRM